MRYILCVHGVYNYIVSAGNLRSWSYLSSRKLSLWKSPTSICLGFYWANNFEMSGPKKWFVKGWKRNFLQTFWSSHHPIKESLILYFSLIYETKQRKKKKNYVALRTFLSIDRIWEYGVLLLFILNLNKVSSDTPCSLKGIEYSQANHYCMHPYICVFTFHNLG